MNENEKAVFSEENPLKEIKDFYESAVSEANFIPGNADNEVIGGDIAAEGSADEVEKNEFSDAAAIFGVSEEDLKSEPPTYRKRSVRAA